MATWPKHLRPRWRYLGVAIEANPGELPDREMFQAALWNELRGLLGDVGSARLDAEVVRFRQVAGGCEAVVRVARDGVREARAVLATLDRVDDRSVGLTVRGVSGTIRACEENYLGAAGEPASHDIVTFDGVESEATVRGEAVDLHRGATPVGATTLDIT
ncbi:MAG: Rpp14/Pop5 family protein [Halobacteriota archaeon]